MTGGEIPVGFVPKDYNVIFYNDANRTELIQKISGKINVFDAHLLDEHAFFISKILDVTPDQKIGINEELNIFCNLLQPRSCTVHITIKSNNDQPVTILEEVYDDMVRIKNISFNHLFTQWVYIHF